MPVEECGVACGGMYYDPDCPPDAGVPMACPWGEPLMYYDGPGTCFVEQALFCKDPTDCAGLPPAPGCEFESACTAWICRDSWCHAMCWGSYWPD